MRLNLTTALTSAMFALLLSGCPDESGHNFTRSPTTFIENRSLIVGPDESVYVFVKAEGLRQLYRIRTNRGFTATLALSLPDSSNHRLLFPEDRVLLLNHKNRKQELKLLDPVTFATQAIETGNTLFKSPRASTSGRHLVVDSASPNIATLHLIDTRTLQTVALPEEGDTSEVLWLPQGERLMMLAFYGQPIERIRVMIWDIDESIFTTSLFPDKRLDVEVEGFAFQGELDYRSIGLSPDGALAAIPVSGLVEEVPIPPEEADAGMSDTLDMDTEAQEDAEEDAPLEDTIEMDVPEEEDVEAEDVEAADSEAPDEIGGDIAVASVDHDVIETFSARPRLLEDPIVFENRESDRNALITDAGDAEDVLEDVALEDATDVEEEPSEPDLPPAVVQSHLLVLDLNDGTWRVVYDAMGPARFTPEGTTLLAQRKTSTGIDLLRIAPDTLVPTPTALAIDDPFVVYEGVSETTAIMSTDNPWFFAIADQDLGQSLSVEGPVHDRSKVIAQLDQDQLWLLGRGLHQLDLDDNILSKNNLGFVPRHLSDLPQNNLIVVDDHEGGEIVFINADSGQITREVALVERAIRDLKYEEEVDECVVDPGVAQVEGRYKLTGQGSREGCEDNRFDTREFDLGATLDIAFSPIDETNATLSLSSPREDFELTGSVRGICITFTTIETLRNGDTVELTWNALSNRSTRSISGTFRGKGPESCTIRGDFRMLPR